MGETFCSDNRNGQRSRALPVILAGGLVQSIALYVMAVVIGECLLFPLTLPLRSIPAGWLIPPTLFYSFGSILCAYHWPEWACRRSAAAFSFFILYETTTGLLADSLSGLTPEESNPLLLGIGALGILLCMFASLIGKRASTGLGAWVRAELAEFAESIGLRR